MKAMRTSDELDCFRLLSVEVSSTARRFAKFDWLYLLICLLFLTGCRGCQLPIFSKDEKAKIDDSGKPQTLPRLELTSLLARPTSGSDGLSMKPNHWYELQQSVRANESDEAFSVSCSSIERAFPYQPVSVLGLREPVSFERNVSLARGQRKLLALEAFFPRMPANTNEEVPTAKQSLRVSYLPRTIGPAVREETFPVSDMPDYQYNFVVLSQNPDRYQFVGGMSCIVWPSEVKMEDERISPFRVVQVAQDQAQDNLPSRLMTWTSTSHLLWNDCAASALVDKQQVALVDWLHFGGQLIINGPESQAALKDSFLSKYSPLVNLRGGRLDASQWEEFSRKWSLARSGEKTIQGIRLPTDYEPPLIEGDLAPGARWVEGCEGLVAEQEIGGGRVVMTTFSLGDTMMVRWPSLSSFFNAALLHRPPRYWGQSQMDGLADMLFVGSMNGKERDPRYVSRVRLLGRDLGRAVPERDSKIVSDKFERNLQSDAPVNDAGDDNSPVKKNRRNENQGVAQVESDSAFSTLAIDTLQNASGIKVPRIKTIVQLLAGYFFILVPLNWAVFRFWGRVELAWLAAPMIAIMGAVVVARSVQLDVGFSRSQTAMNLLDLKSGYRRGHLSSYLSLYTSLSTRYSARYPGNEGVVLPIASSALRARAKLSDENSLHYEYADESGAGLKSFPVRSNSISFLRGEDLLDVEGVIELAWEDPTAQAVIFKNASSVALKECAVIAKLMDGHLAHAWIGQLAKDAKGRASLVQLPKLPNERNSPTWNIFEEWKGDTDSKIPSFVPASLQQGTQTEAGLRVGAALDHMAVQHSFGLGEIVLLGWTDQSLMKIEIKPKGSQSEEKTLVVVRKEALGPTQIFPDTNLPSVPLPEELQ